MPETPRRLLYLVTEDWYFVSHRFQLARVALEQGFDVAVVTRFSHHRQTIEDAGLRAISFDMNRRGLNPLTLLREAAKLTRVFRRERPDVLHLVALRPIMVGGLAAYFAGVSKVVSAVTGMGFLFTNGGRMPWVRWAVRKTLPWLLSRGLAIIQNPEDARQLTSFGLRADCVRLIAGAGVDTALFSPTTTSSDISIVMMASRLLWDKGGEEFVAAARLLRDRRARFVLVGAVDTDNPASIPEMEIRRWVAEGVVEWWGRSDDMPTTLGQADIVCLPSYREGLPKVLLEAMACGKACVTTDVPGCREAVRNEDNGLLVPAKDALTLAKAIGRLLDDKEDRIRMGLRGRERAIAEFSVSRTIDDTLAVYREILQ